jgi:hypothetical protein
VEGKTFGNTPGDFEQLAHVVECCHPLSYRHLAFRSVHNGQSLLKRTVCIACCHQDVAEVQPRTCVTWFQL